ncbi:MAG: hypothetical protein U0350_19295 [Caldilineaceae bacterium]
MTQSNSSITRELNFITAYTGEDELTLLSRALNLGLNMLFRQAAEQALIDNRLPREEAITILGMERVRGIEYAKLALEQDIRRGLTL